MFSAALDKAAKDQAEAKSRGGGTNGNQNLKKTLDVLALGNSIGTGPKGITAEVIEVKSFDDLESKKEDVKGKIVFYNYKFNPTFVSTFQSYGDAVKYRGGGSERSG